MLSTALTVFISSTIISLILLVVIHKELRSGKRFFAGQLRSWLDYKIENLGNSIIKGYDHFSKYIVQLNWYYSIHSFWRTMLKVTSSVYFYFENRLERNRTRTKQLRAEKRQLSEHNHLQKMSEHRKETALTPSQQRKLKDKKLEGK